MSLRVLIAGGGISGLTAALACIDAGFEVEVFEQAPALSEIGAGIQIGPNAARVMHALGLEDAFARLGSRPAFQEMRLGDHNLNIFRSALGQQAEAKYGAPYYLLHRADLINILADALKARAPGALKTGTAVKTYEAPEGGSCVLTFEDGRQAEGDVLIGADGIRSVFRTQMLGAEQPRFTGNIVWRAMVPSTPRLKAMIPDSMCIWTGPDKHCVTYWLRGGTLLNFVGAVEHEAWIKESWNEAGDKAEFAADFGGWSKPISAIVEAAQECTRWGLFDRDPMPKWVDGQAALIGDACHPMLPFLAQGAAMAIEDAWVIVQCLASGEGSVHERLMRYQEARKPRTAKVQGAARARMHSNHLQSLMQRLKTYGPMWLSSRTNPADFDKRYDWLFEHDVVADFPAYQSAPGAT